ncbi:hypothetical protein [Dysgonomonas termitidis]|uniref:Histidine kinase N-terminal 7TM region domain-containing protein n=1 Tax=Dysgonomonas termitidis TaxID=1516126 RepID=A0ABV9L494_9BACT
MELIIQILMLFIIINCILKLSFWKWWQAAIFSIVCAVFLLWAEQYAILQSKTQINDYLMNREALQDAAVLVTIESVICFAFCFAALRNLFGRRIKRWLLPLYWYPSLLLFPVLFYILTQSIFSLSGTDFDTVSYIMAGTVLVILPMAAYGIRYMFPEKELRLEVHFLVSLFVAILGLLTTVNGNVTYAVAEEPVNFKALGLSLALFAIAFLIGYVWNKIRWRIMQRKQMKK